MSFLSSLVHVRIPQTVRTSISCGMVTDYDHINISYSCWKYFPFMKREACAACILYMLYLVTCTICTQHVHSVLKSKVHAPKPQVVCVENDLIAPSSFSLLTGTRRRYMGLNEERNNEGKKIMLFTVNNVKPLNSPQAFI